MNDTQRYCAAAHAMQSGVAMEMNIPGRQSGTEPKHLRVGINGAMADIGSLARLLIEKGIITEAEYLKAIADGMEREVASYEKLLTQAFGRPVSLI